MSAPEPVLTPGRYRVVRIISRLIVGGPAWHVMHLAGLEPEYPTLLITGGVEPGEQDVLEEARARGISVLRLPGLGRTVNPAQDVAALAQLVRVLRTIRPEVVHTHTAKAGAVGRTAAALAGVPIRVHTFHGHVFDHYFGPVATRAILAAERTLAKLTTRIVAISERQADDLSGRFRIAPRERISVIPLGLDLERFADLPREPERSAFRAEVGAGERPVIACVGRLAPVKRHDVMLQAFARLRAGGTDAVLAIVGGGVLEAGLRQQAETLGVAAHVRFLGYRRDLVRVYAGSDVVALSSDAEGTPVSLIEAIVAGVPVVATAVGGVSDLLDGGALGTLVPARDPAALALAVAGVVRRPDGGRPTMAQRASVQARFSAARLRADMTRLYDELGGISRPGHHESPAERTRG